MVVAITIWGEWNVVRDRTKVRLAADQILKIQQLIESHPETIYWDNHKLKIALQESDELQSSNNVNSGILPPLGAEILVQSVNTKKNNYNIKIKAVGLSIAAG